jgi:hypothetical protein
MGTKEKSWNFEAVAEVLIQNTSQTPNEKASYV